MTLRLLLFLIILILFQYIPAQDKPGITADKIKLAAILKKTREYCSKLERAAFHFVSLEEVTEKISIPENLTQDITAVNLRDLDRSSHRLTRTGKTDVNTFLYDYQLIKKEGQDEETRILLEKNRKKIHRKDALLEIQQFRYEKLVFGPSGLLSQYWQRYYDYEIVREEKLNGEKVVVIDAVPKASLSENYPFGKIWVRENDFAILKIEWDEKSLEGLQSIKERAERYRAEPRITLISEFGYEKNEIRFPSRFTFEEAYLDSKGEKFIRLEIIVVYRDYKFFTVDVDVKY
ncbi:MAG: outer membrane lipoprotein-sorting protein [Candidatus Aminicenantes bacterium]|nr:outer membrane lipoprotein-sorting protein [Candidatus Aminicenantes bacterium]